MKTIKFLTLALTGVIISCNSQVQNTQATYELVPDDMNILVEKFDSLNTDQNKYNYNNEVFKVGTKFTYEFKHFTPENELKRFKVNDDKKSWDFVESNNTEDAVVKNVIIGTLKGNPMAKYVPDYNQTAVSYQFKENSPFSMSGVIENEANLWIHPPRDHYFKILELNPFPYIKAPYEVGTQWTWKLLIGSHWGDERWKTWEGNIQNDYQYEITAKKTLSTAIGDLECFVIESTGKSSLGETALTAYFHPKFGFVKLDYTNIDGSKTLLTLVDHSAKETIKKAPKTVAFNQELADELKKMAKVDQIAAYIPQGEYKKMSREEWKQFKDSVFTTHGNRLKELFNEHGFVGYDLAGKAGSQYFWLMVQHCDYDPEFQAAVLEKMKIEVEKQNASSSNYALLVDRVNINTGKQQVYGTQVDYRMEICQAFPKNLADAENVNQRREKIGLEPIEKYLNEMSTMHYEMNKKMYVQRGLKAPTLYQ